MQEIRARLRYNAQSKTCKPAYNAQFITNINPLTTRDVLQAAYNAQSGEYQTSHNARCVTVTWPRPRAGPSPLTARRILEGRNIYGATMLLANVLSVISIWRPLSGYHDYSRCSLNIVNTRSDLIKQGADYEKCRVHRQSYPLHLILS